MSTIPDFGDAVRALENQEKAVRKQRADAKAQKKA